MAESAPHFESNPGPEAEGTRLRILDAAEKLFAEYGFKATSLRLITEEAHANLAAVNYHFGTKENLVAAVISRVLQPINAERLRLLDQAEAGLPEKAPALETVLHAFFKPGFDLVKDESRAGAVKLLGKTMHENQAFMRKIMTEDFAQLINRFLQALGRAVPFLSPSQILLRFHFAVGAMIHAATQYQALEILNPGAAYLLDRTLDELIVFCAAGFRAPCLETQSAP
jgi:AcrR family transcriptional regulator